MPSLLALFASGAAFGPAVFAAPQAAAPSQTSAQTQDALQSRLADLARRAAPAQMGIAVLDVASGKRWGIDTDVPFIMMSVFKAPVAATVLSQIEAHKLSLEQQVTLLPGDLVEGSAIPSVGKKLRAGRTVFTVRELLTGAVSESDSTAADALVRLVGGPQVVTAFLRRHGIAGMRVDTGEGGIGRVADHLRDGETIPAAETAAQTLARERLGYADMLADPRNRSTPAAAVDFLRKLSAAELLGPQSTQLLMDLMRRQTVPSRLRGGIPAGADFADKTGSSSTVGGSNAAWNDIAIMTLADGRRICMAVFLKDTAMPKPDRDLLFADIARAVAAGVSARGAGR